MRDLDIIRSATVIGLTLNQRKSEIICENSVTRGTILVALPGALVVDPSKSCLLVSPLGCVDSVSATLQEKVASLN